MRIYIDESGGFIVPQQPSSRVSCVAALVIPEADIPELFRDFKALRSRFTDSQEIKGSELTDGKTLNKEGVPGPQGALWGPSTIHGNPKRRNGILHNELYIGRLIWNRLRYLKDPDTGKRVSRPNPESAWVIKEVPSLRIIDDDTWQAVRDRYAAVQRKWSTEAKASFNQFRRPRYLFSGLTKCGQCGAGFIVHSRELLGCFGARDRGTCTNTLRISRLDVESRVLSALQTKLLRKDFFEEFCREFTKR